MVETRYGIGEERIRRFLEQYVLPYKAHTDKNPIPMNHDELQVITGDEAFFSLLTEQTNLLERRIYPNEINYLGEFNLVSNDLQLHGPTYNNGRPKTEELKRGFRRLGILFGVEILVE